VSSKTAEGAWSKAENLEAINTSADDASPFVYADDQTLFFASKGRAGFGGFDLYKSTWQVDHWSAPQNVGPAINNQYDQIGYAISVKGEAFYSSTSEQGRIELRRLRVPKGILPDIELINFRVQLIDSLTGKKIKGAVSVKTQNRNIPLNPVALGEFEGLLNQLPVSLEANADGYQKKSIQVKSSPLKVPMVRQSSLKVFQPIAFNTGAYQLSDKAKATLNEVVVYAQSNPQSKIRIDAYTDSQGAKELNDWLSQKRANATAQFLMKQGLSSERMTLHALGEQKAISQVGDDQNAARFRIVMIRFQ